jgi:tRNA pseudouridine-54 N-methylase
LRRDTQLHVVVHSRQNGRKQVRFETDCVQQVVLEQLAWVVRFVEHLQGQIRMRSVGQLSQPVLQLSGQIDNISAAANPQLRRLRRLGSGGKATEAVLPEQHQRLSQSER